MHIFNKCKLALVCTCILLIISVVVTTVESLTQLNACIDYRFSGSNDESINRSIRNNSFFWVSTDNDLTSNCISTFEKDVKLGSDLSEIFQTMVDPKKLSYRVWNAANKTEYFTPNGDYYDGFHYFQPSEYCVKSLSKSVLKLLICNPLCNSSTVHPKSCIPKCCAPDEVLRYWNFRCRKLRSNEPKWKPVICEDDECKPVISSDVLHYTSHKITCKDSILRSPLTTMIYSEDDENDVETKTKLVVINEKIRMTQLSEDRIWKLSEINYCVDMFVPRRDSVYVGDPSNVVFMTCLEEDVNFPKVLVVAWATASTLLHGSTFLMIIVTIYVLLLPQLNFNGLCILSYSLGKLCSYVTYSIAHFITIRPELAGEGTRGMFCMGIAVSSHYFLIASDFWLVLMNLSLFLTVRSKTPIDSSSKRPKAFVLFSIVAWGLPFLFISVCVVVDEVYRDPLTYVVVPDYATRSCSVAIWSRGYYVYAPLAVFLIVNGILMILTIRVIFIRARKSAKMLTKSRQDTYSTKLFAKLLCIMGTVWFVHLIVWLYDDGMPFPWYVVVTQTIMILQPVPLFFLFCCNAKTKEQLKTKFSNVSKWCRRLNG